MFAQYRLPLRSLRLSLIALSVASLWVHTSHADSMLIPVPNSAARPSAGVAPLLSATDPGSQRFRPVGEIRSFIGVGWMCTGTLVASVERPRDDQPALVVTAGHCSVNARLTGDNDVVIDSPMQPGFYFTPNFFYDNQADHRRYEIRRVVYSTMKGTDLGLLELSATYGELRSAGIKPTLLKNFEPVDRAIESAHIPFFATPGGGIFLRHSVCKSESGRPVFESEEPIRVNFPWFWSQSRPNDCIGVYGGSSGAPVFSKDGRQVIAVISTLTDPGHTGCGYARPCELTDSGTVSRKDAVYTNSVDQFVAAMRPDNTLDLSKLDPGTGVKMERSGSWSTRSTVADADGKLQPAQWNLKVSDAFEFIRFKTGPASSIQCAQAKGYGEPMKVTDQPLIKLGVGDKEGIQAMCVIGKRLGQEPWQAMQYATVKLRQLDNTPPTQTPNIYVREDEVGFWSVGSTVTFNENKESYYKFGARDSTNCQSHEGYALFHDFLRLSKTQDWRYCAYGVDVAGNASPVVSQDLVRKESRQ
ncbi:trypsin-like serine peptidase [Pseudomonas sp.]|uniref:trypsin-like serine peptidase n=1 Tax=Pseudomonas sp. TaxID=306 RepID=UPI003BB7BD14